jgi:hypothetical protein
MYRRALPALLLLSPGFAIHAQTVLTHVTLQQHQENTAALQRLIHECASDAKACTADRVGPDESIDLDANTMSHVRYGWLRKALPEMATATQQQRTAKGEILLQHLSIEAAAPQPRHDVRKEADAVLQQVEFKEAKPSWWQRLSRRVELWLARHLDASNVSDSTISWARVLLEVILFAIPLLALGLWLMRQLREDRLVPEQVRGAKQETPASISWVKEAEACAQRGEWREAIHALYWQTITGFEERRIWAIVRNRTPREYLALLQPGSEQRRLLREQTVLLESVWYGRREATEVDYQRAAGLAQELSRA